jgi:hypothetical protein
MPNARPVNVFAKFRFGLGIAACLSLIPASASGAASGHFAQSTFIESITAILILAILQSTRRLGISELLNAGK